MNILEALVKLRDDLKTWVANNLKALDSKIEKNIVSIDSELSTKSTNPVQNKIITNAINSLPRDYSDLANAPNIIEDESGEIAFADEAGNIIFKADADGIHSTSLTLNGEDIKVLLEQKVDKEKGKGLSSNDYTDEDKAKLSLISNDIVSATIDSELSTTSDNPVKNKVITNALNNIDYNNLVNTPNITEDNSDSVVIADDNGYVVAKVDKDGVHAAGLMLNGENVLNRINTKFNEINETIENYDRLRIGLVPLGTRIEANTELNSIEMIRVGSYYCASNATTATLLNCPTQLAFIMQVYSPISTNIDNEETNQWVYRVRKILTYEGTEFTQTVYSGSEPGVFIYKPWQSVVKMEYSTTDLTTGSSTLATGNLYVVYE